MRRAPITAKGAEKFKLALQTLKSVDRPAVITAIAEARAHGDLKENAEYHAAKEQQGFIEGRIAEIEGSLAGAEIIDPSTVNANGRVVFGATVTLINVLDNNEVRYQIVGDLEADIAAGMISISSPISRALIGKQDGDIAVVQAPAGDIEYEIIEVNYI
jgi:transcription elongation factor GreA